MTRSDWMTIAARMRTNWPHVKVPDASLAKWYDDLKHLDAGVVTAAVESLYRTGERFPPNGGQILGEIGRQTVDAPEFGEAWHRITWAVGAYGWRSRERVLEYLDRKHPALATLADEIGLREIGMAPEGDTTMFAQARDRYTRVVARHHRTVTHSGLPPAVAHELRPVRTAMRELAERSRP